MNILIPMAGDGKRFKDAGYTLPKPMIPIHGKAMIEYVIESLNLPGHYIFLVRREHEKEYEVSKLLKQLRPDCSIIYVDGLTEGAACTCLLAKDLINNDEPLVIASCDQYVKYDAPFFQELMDWYDGVLLTFWANHPKWSYCKVEKGFVSKVAEKTVISNHGNTGIYAFKKGSDYVKAAETMIQKNIRVNNEFYNALVYNQLIEDKKRIITFDVDSMLGTGTPEDLIEFEKWIKLS